MGGNKVAPPGKNKLAANPTGKIYSGKSNVANNIGVPPASSAAGPKKFGSSMGVGNTALEG